MTSKRPSCGGARVKHLLKHITKITLKPIFFGSRAA